MTAKVASDNLNLALAAKGFVVTFADDRVAMGASQRIAGKRNRLTPVNAEVAGDIVSAHIR